MIKKLTLFLSVAVIALTAGYVFAAPGNQNRRFPLIQK